MYSQQIEFVLCKLKRMSSCIGSIQSMAKTITSFEARRKKAVYLESQDVRRIVDKSRVVLLGDLNTDGVTNKRTEMERLKQRSSTHSRISFRTYPN